MSMYYINGAQCAVRSDLMGQGLTKYMGLLQVQNADADDDGTKI